MENNVKIGHPVLGIVLGILGILIAFLLTLIAGVVAGGLALLLGIAAILIGVSSKKKGGKGIGAIVMGGLAVVLAISMTLTSVNGLKAVSAEAEKVKPGSLVARYCDNPYFGLIGIASKIPQDEAGLQELMNELDELQALSTAAATDPAN